MTIIPATIVDNFFDNPNSIVNWGLSLDYKSDPTNKWPGKRTENLKLIHPYFHDYVCNKVLSLFFENKVEYDIALTFQLLENYQGKGWIHQDPGVFTFIIYLSEENPKIDCGTTLWSLNPNLISPINSDKDYYALTSRLEHHEIKKLDNNNQDLFYKNHKKELLIPDKFNRLLAFSSDHLHSANNLNNGSPFRLTLTGFVNKLNTSKLPIIRSKQTLLI